MRTIAHVYDSYSEASRVVQALESAGIPHSDISIVSGDKSHASTGYGATDNATGGTATGMTSGDPEQGAATGAGTGASLGTVLGGGAGLLAGIGALAIPGLGPIVAAGWLVAALTGAGVGAAAGGLLGSLTGAGISEADAQTYQEGVNSGGTLVTVRVDDAQAAHVEQVMGMTTSTSTDMASGMAAGTGMGVAGTTMMDTTATTSVMPETTTTRDIAMGTGAAGMMDAPVTPPKTGRDTTSYDTTRTTGMGTGAMNTGAMNTGAMNTGDTIKVMKEDLAVGKREVDAGGVRVTSHVVETPVQEQVTLHEEHVTLERRPVNERIGSADAFRDQTIEARASAEEAVVAKEARVVEEIGIRKEATDRVETVRDTVRETKVDVEDTAATVRPTTTTTTTTDTTKRV